MHTHIYLKHVSWNYTYLYYVYIFWFSLFFKKKKKTTCCLDHRINFIIHYIVVMHNKTLDI